MRKLTNANLIVANLIAAAAFLVLLGGPAALAQNNTRTGNSATSGTSSTSTSSGPLEAPIGHRQPRAGDVPSEKGVTKLDAEDAALDRKIKSICRGC
jgi:hypothetical protein